MAAFLVHPAAGGTAFLSGILVAAGGSKSREMVLTAATIVGYVLSSAILLAPTYTFVYPIWKKKRVGNRTTFGHVWTMFGCTVWTLFAMPTFRDNVWTVIINGAGSLLNLGYTGCFIYFAAKEARRLGTLGSPSWLHGLYLLLGTLGVSTILAALVIEQVMIRRVWGTKFIGVIASIVTGIGSIFVLHDLMAILKSCRASNKLEALLELLLNVSNVAIWKFCAFMSTPVDLYSGIPCAIGGGCLLAQLAAHLRYRIDDDDFGLELRALFESLV